MLPWKKPALLAGVAVLWVGPAWAEDAAAFFNARRRLLHDILLGTVIINSAARVPAGL